MKKLFLLAFVPFFLTACVGGGDMMDDNHAHEEGAPAHDHEDCKDGACPMMGGSDHQHAPGTPKDHEHKDMPTMDMNDMPCHQMPDGSWMGKCDKPHDHPKGTSDHDHTETETHTHAPGTPKDHPHDEDDHHSGEENAPPHRH